MHIFPNSAYPRLSSRLIIHMLRKHRLPPVYASITQVIPVLDICSDVTLNENLLGIDWVRSNQLSATRDTRFRDMAEDIRAFHTWPTRQIPPPTHTQ